MRLKVSHTIRTGVNGPTTTMCRSLGTPRSDYATRTFGMYPCTLKEDNSIKWIKRVPQWVVITINISCQYFTKNHVSGMIERGSTYPKSSWSYLYILQTFSYTIWTKAILEPCLTLNKFFVYGRVGRKMSTWGQFSCIHTSIRKLWRKPNS